jgi:flagellar protein FliO/FliZ
MFKMLMGLAIVLAVMGLITWVLKRMMPGVGGQQSVIRVVGSASVGSRERVVVVEVGDRWLVVGVAPGQVSSIANLEAGDPQTAQVLTQGGLPNSNLPGFAQPMVNSFAGWLKQSSDKFKRKSED